MNPSNAITLAGILVAAKGAAYGTVIAAAVDVTKWSNSDGPFDWKVAGRRYIGGFAKGLLIGLGIAIS